MPRSVAVVVATGPATCVVPADERLYRAGLFAGRSDAGDNDRSVRAPGQRVFLHSAGRARAAAHPRDRRGRERADVAWYNGGPAPGAPGSAVINGHLDGKEVPQAVFYNLGKLKPGDLVEVEDKKGRVVQFRVTGTKLYDYDAPTAEIFAGDASKTQLNLITCTGDWLKTEKLYSKRIVVFTELVQ